MSLPFMQRAIALAIEAVAEGGGPFGAVIVMDGEIIGSGKNSVVPSADPTAHAEVMAIRDACRRRRTHDLTGASIYSSCEPCPMCWGAIRWAHMASVRYGCTRSDAALIGFDDELLHADFRRDPGEWGLDIQSVDREAALAAFRAWETKVDRRPY